MILKGADAATAQLKAARHALDNALRLKPDHKARPPGLVVIQVGNNPASGAYIRQKKKAAENSGISFVHDHLESSVTRLELLKRIQHFSSLPEVDGILLQLPLDSPTLNTPAETAFLLHSIPPEKDADGLHTLNQGRLFTAESTPSRWTSPLPATPLGVFRLLEHYGYNVSGRDIVVVGKSRLVGLPTAGLLSQEGATVTLCHKLTQHLAKKTREAEILVVAAGSKHLITAEYVNPHMTVVDVGIHVQEDGKLTGDMHPECQSLVKSYSPVPGGVGPMTVASLMENVFRLSTRNQTH